MRRLAVLLLALACPGCIGLGLATVGGREGEADSPHFGRTGYGDRVVDRRDAGAEPIASALLLEQWGEPESRETQDDGSELWRYKGMPSCAGVVLIVLVLPIPLVIPTGREYVEFEVRDGTVVRAYSCANAMLRGGFFGYGTGVCGVHGWGGEWFALPAEGFSNPFE